MEYRIVADGAKMPCPEAREERKMAKAKEICMEDYMEEKKDRMELSDVFVCEDRERSTYFKHVAAPLFRKSFQVEEGAAFGELSICGLGFYELFVNGSRITKGPLAPYISNPDHIVYYDSYVITPWLRPGENVIGIMLGDGFQNSKTCVWDFDGNVFNAAPRLAVLVRIGGNIRFDVRNFKCKKGPVVFNDLRSGTFYDRRLEDPGWNQPGFLEDESWHEPLAADRPRGQAKYCEAEPIAVTKELPPVSVREGELTKYQPREDVRRWLSGRNPQEEKPSGTGGYLFDFGENNAGIFRLRIKGKPGQRIDIQCAEQLVDGKADYNNTNFFPDGYVQRDIYIVGSREEEIYEPFFTYHGFRYLYVSGITTEQAFEEGFLTYLVMSSGLEERGDFSCSDATANRIFQMARRSDRANFYYFPTDCPHREKNGWTGDAQVSAEHMILTMGVERSWREWLHNIRCAQRSNGMLPGIVPTGSWGYDWGNGPAWDRALFELPYMTFRYRGDKEIILENAHAMLSYLEYLSRARDGEGIVSLGLGDLGPVDRENSSDYLLPVGFTDSVMAVCMCVEAAEMFGAVGLKLHEKFAAQLGAEFRAAVRRSYIDFGRMLMRGNCQSGQAMGIFYDIFDSGEKPEAFRRLLEIIEKDGRKMTCGFLGARVLFHVLAAFGQAQLAYEMITGTKYPAYGYFARRGDTTLPEQIQPDERRRMLSGNHHFLGDVAGWYIQWPGGIHIKNSRKIFVKPCFIPGLEHVKASHRLPVGEVRVAWQREENGILLEAEWPKEVSCDLELEPGYMFAGASNSWLAGGDVSEDCGGRRRVRLVVSAC